MRLRRVNIDPTCPSLLLMYDIQYFDGSDRVKRLYPNHYNKSLINIGGL